MIENGNTMAAMWSYGRRLTGLSSGSEAFSYSYNADGIRTAKTVNGVKHTYALSGTTILNEEWTENGVQHLLMYVYDANGSPVGMVYRNSTMAADATEEYLFVKNIQGDILYVYSSTGNKLVSYVYDAWGNIISTTYSNGGATTAARFNPFTYRGYYRDSETGMYYLNSRYYNPKMGRFISADAYVSTGQGLLGFNMYAYCNNNPVNLVDPSGCLIGIDDIAMVFVGSVFLLLSTTVLLDSENQLNDIADTLYASLSLSSSTVSFDLSGWHNDYIPHMYPDVPASTTMAIDYSDILEGVTVLEKRDGPIGKAGRKKQGRERNNKGRFKDGWNDRSNKDPDRPMKKHTPGRDHRHKHSHSYIIMPYIEYDKTSNQYVIKWCVI